MSTEPSIKRKTSEHTDSLQDITHEALEDDPQRGEKSTSHEHNEEGNDTDNPPSNYPQGFQLGLIMIALCLSILLVALDNTILVTAIPKIVSIAFPKCNI